MFQFSSFLPQILHSYWVGGTGWRAIVGKASRAWLLPSTKLVNFVFIKAMHASNIPVWGKIWRGKKTLYRDKSSTNFWTFIGTPWRNRMEWNHKSNMRGEIKREDSCVPKCLCSCLPLEEPALSLLASPTPPHCNKTTFKSNTNWSLSDKNICSWGRKEIMFKAIVKNGKAELGWLVERK